MKGRFKFTKDEDFQQTNHMYGGVEIGYISRPLKSPSPDKKSANIIASTKSPELNEIKRNPTPHKEQYSSLKQIQKSQVKQKHFQILNTPNRTGSYKNVDTGASSKKYQEKHPTVQQYKITSSPNTKSRNIKIEIAADNPAQQFQIRSSSRYRSEFRGELTELDYLKILKGKEEHIRELKEILQEYQHSNHNRRGSEMDQYTLRSLESKINNLNGEIKELKVQNQYLLSALQKSKNVPNPNREQILQRQIRQLRESLRDKQFQFEQATSTFNKKHEKDRLDIKNLQEQNQSLIQLLKQKKEENEKSKQDLSNSALSLKQSQLSRSSQKDKLSLVKIKQVHQQNIRIAQQTFYNQIKFIEEGFSGQIQQLHNKVQQLSNQLTRLQSFKLEAQRKLQQKDRNSSVRQEHHRQKQRHQQIETVLLEKYSYYENQLHDHKKENQRLTKELNQAHKNIEALQQREQELPYNDGNAQTAMRRENQDLVQTIKILQNELDKNHSQKERIIGSKDQQIKQLQSKVEVLMEEYESKIKVYKNQHQSKLASLESQIRTLKFREEEIAQAHQREKNQIERQLKDALKLYDKQNSGLKQSVLQKNSEINTLVEQNERLKSQLLRISQEQKGQDQLIVKMSQENEHLKQRYINLQREVQTINHQLYISKENLELEKRQKEHLSRIVDQVQDENTSLRDNLLKSQQIYKMNESLQNYIRNLQNQNKQLQKALSQISQKLVNTQQTHKQLINNIHSELYQTDEENNTLKSKLKDSQQLLISKQQQYEELRLLLDSLKTERSSLRYETIEEQLKELKIIISQYYSRNKNRLDNEIIEEYFKLNHAHQIKIDENLKLIKEIESLKIQLSNQLKQKLILNQKISLLENNIAIYERQLKQRRQLYEQILQEKIRIEKQVLLSKKIKTQQSNLVESFKINTTQITSKIDRLVQFQRQRYRQIKNLMQEQYSS